QERRLHAVRQARSAQKRKGLHGGPDRCDGNTCRTSSKKQRRYYSGKKKRHALKAQLVVDRATVRILCLAHDAGRRHDFRLFKVSGVRLHPETEAITDTGYMGLQKLHGKT